MTTARGKLLIKMTAADIARVFPGALFTVEVYGEGRDLESLRAADFDDIRYVDWTQDLTIDWGWLTEQLHEQTDEYREFDEDDE